MSAIVAPFVGALSATLLTFLFAGQFMKLDMVPNVSINAWCVPCDPCQTNSTNATATSLATNQVNGATNVAAGNARAAIAKAPTNTAATSATTDSLETADKTTGQHHEGKKHLWPYHLCLAGASELPKLLIWCFIAGFSERLVPDIIDRLGAKAKEKA